MAWEELDFDKAHRAYIILGGFTSLFMLCSLFIKEKLYIGEATVATLVGLIFGPHAANLFDPSSWGNVDKITLELSRIVLVVQCFAVGVELPKAYMERHWRSITFLLVPIMTIGWLVTALIIYLCINPLSWLSSLAIAACVTATDPVLASSVVGKGKFAKRVPRHLRDVLSAESGCNDGMAFPFIYLSFYLLQYHSEAREVTFHWFVLIILYECIFGAFYGFMVGYIGRHAIKLAERKNLIDRDSFLVFYFVLALFCAGSASGLGLDDLLVGFAAGVGFSNDGWFVEKTEESHVSNVIDLLLNLSYFVYLGAIIPWQDYNAPEIGLQPWRLVIIAIAVILFRRIPAMLLMKPLIPDVKNWREALFAGHFGPIGVGAIFAVILLRAELETDSTEPLAELPGPDNEFYLLLRTCWPIVTFLVISSILVHGSSIAVFTLGKRINTLTLTMSYTTEGEQNWMDRLPRIASRSKSMSRNSKLSDDSSYEKGEFPPGSLGPIGVPHTFLRRQKEDEQSGRSGNRFESRRTRRRRRTSAGGPVDESAIGSVWRQPSEQDPEKKGEQEDEDATPEGDIYEGGEGNYKEDTSSTPSPEIEAFREGDDLIVEDQEGNVIDRRNVKGEDEEQIKRAILADRDMLRRETTGEHAKDKHHPHTRNEGEEIENHILENIEHPQKAWKKWLGQTDKQHNKPKRKPHSGAAQAYQYGNKIIVEDADGEVVKTYEIPRGEQSDPKEAGSRPFLNRVNTWKGFGKTADAEEDNNDKLATATTEDEDDKHVRFRVGGSNRRMSKTDFIKQIQSLDPKARIEAVHDTDAPENLKKDVETHAKVEGKLDEHTDGGFLSRKFSRGDGGDGDGNFLTRRLSRDDGAGTSGGIGSFLTRRLSRGQNANLSAPARESSRGAESSPSRSPRRPSERPSGSRRRGSTSTASTDRAIESQGRDIPMYDVHSSIAAASQGRPETAAQLRRRLAAERAQSRQQAAGRDEDSDDDGTERIPPAMRHRRPSATIVDLDDDEETAAERGRRLAALGLADSEDDSDEEQRNERPAQHSAPAVAEPPRAHIRDRAVGAGGTGGIAGNVKPNDTITEEPGEMSPPVSPGTAPSASASVLASASRDQASAAPASPTTAEMAKSPGIRFAEPPRGEGRGRSKRFGRTMGMRTSRKSDD